MHRIENKDFNNIKYTQLRTTNILINLHNNLTLLPVLSDNSSHIDWVADSRPKLMTGNRLFFSQGNLYCPVERCHRHNWKPATCGDRVLDGVEESLDTFDKMVSPCLRTPPILSQMAAMGPYSE